MRRVTTARPIRAEPRRAAALPRRWPRARRRPPIRPTSPRRHRRTPRAKPPAGARPPPPAASAPRQPRHRGCLRALSSASGGMPVSVRTLHGAAIDGREHASEHGDAERAAELEARLGDGRGGAGALGRRGGHDDIGGDGADRRQCRCRRPACRRTAATASARRESCVSSAKPTADNSRPVAITVAGAKVAHQNRRRHRAEGEHDAGRRRPQCRPRAAPCRAPAAGTG